jgi:hypothetical protein
MNIFLFFNYNFIVLHNLKNIFSPAMQNLLMLLGGSTFPCSRLQDTLLKLLYKFTKYKCIEILYVIL